MYKIIPHPNGDIRKKLEIFSINDKIQEHRIERPQHSKKMENMRLPKVVYRKAGCKKRVVNTEELIYVLREVEKRRILLTKNCRNICTRGSEK